MSSGEFLIQPAPAPSSATCWVCFGGGSNNDPLVRNCACRGNSTGWAHLSCISKCAKRDAENVLGHNTEQALTAWQLCKVCKKDFVGNVAISMATAYVESVEHLHIMDQRHFQARHNLASTKFDIGDYGGAQKIYDSLMKKLEQNSGQMDTRLRKSQLLSGLAPVYMKQRKFHKAITSLKEEYELELELYGSTSHPKVQQTEFLLNHIKGILNHGGGGNGGRSNNGIAKAKRAYEVAVKQYGKDSEMAYANSLALTKALEHSGQLVEALELMQEQVQSSRRALGPAHPSTKRMEHYAWDLRAKASGNHDGVVKATIVGLPDSSSTQELNGRDVQVLRQTKDGSKYIVAIDEIETGSSGNKTRKFKAAPLNLVFAVNTVILLKGLVSAPHLNGKGGVILSFSDEKQRYVVNVVKGNKKVMIKPENLEVASMATTTAPAEEEGPSADEVD